jgi:enoyl-CoA hydratase/carnithine racemase
MSCTKICRRITSHPRPAFLSFFHDLKAGMLCLREVFSLDEKVRRNMTQEGRISTERQGHVLLIGLDRVAKRNAFDKAMLAKLSMAYAELERDDQLRCGVLFAHGDHFTSGLELTQFAASLGHLEYPEEAIDPFGLRGPHRTKPVISAVQGICLTAGIELLLATDVRIAASDARFAQIEIKRGLFPFAGATIRFPREVGWGNAMRYLLTGDEFDAAEALRMGLVQEVVEPGRQLARAIELAQVVSAQAPLGVRTTLKSARLAMNEGEEAAAQQFLPDLQAVLKSEDLKEGIQSFIERRPANFKGR